MNTDQQQDYRFTTKQIENFADLYGTLKKIHLRLINEGYIIKNGEMITPNRGDFTNHTHKL